MTKQIAGIIPVQSTPTSDHPTSKKVNRDSLFQKLCGQPIRDVPNELSGVAIPSNN